MNTGYHFPEPAVFAVVLVSETRKRYLANWLALRPLWLGRIANQPHLPVPGPKVWRAFLNSTPSAVTSPSRSSVTTFSGGAKQDVVEFFEDNLLEMGMASTWAGDVSVDFRGKIIKITSLADPPLDLVHSILWELAELSLRYDLLILDKFLVP
ncbi:hypothetical protein BU15DRAFT_49390, partial [Melanogaster broomeanus]